MRCFKVKPFHAGRGKTEIKIVLESGSVTRRIECSRFVRIFKTNRWLLIAFERFSTFKKSRISVPNTLQPLDGNLHNSLSGVYYTGPKHITNSYFSLIKLIPPHDISSMYHRWWYLRFVIAQACFHIFTADQMKLRRHTFQLFFFFLGLDASH